MDEKKLNLHEWLEKFEAGEFNTWDTTTQIEAGWYDWFCKDASLANKTQRLGKKLASIITSKRLSPKTQYVFFKNNCPGMGSLYDDFRICDIVTGDVVYTIIPSSGHDSQRGIAFVYGRENDFKEPLAQGKWGDVKKWFMEK